MKTTELRLNQEYIDELAEVRGAIKLAEKEQRSRNPMKRAKAETAVRTLKGWERQLRDNPVIEGEPQEE